MKNNKDIKKLFKKSFFLIISFNANRTMIPEDKKNENLNCVETKQIKTIIEKIVKRFFLFFSNGITKKVNKNATKFDAIGNNWGLAVNVKNKKLGMHNIAKHIKILDSKLKFKFLFFNFKIEIIIENKATNCKIEESL